MMPSACLGGKAGSAAGRFRITRCCPMGRPVRPRFFSSSYTTMAEVSLGPTFKTPAARDKQGNKRGRDEQAVFGIENVKVALGSKDNIVIAAEINDGATRWLTSAEIANFKRFKAERICWVKDAASVESGLADKIAGAAQSRSRLRNLIRRSRRDNRIEQRHLAERINVGPDEIRHRRALLQHPFVVGERPRA